MRERYLLNHIETSEGLEITKEYNDDTRRYRIIIQENGNKIYANNLTESQNRIYGEFIKARLDVLLQEHGKLSKPFCMFEMGNRMYSVCDWENRDHRELKVECVPLGYEVDNSRTVDLLLDSTLWDVFPYEPNTLVYRFGHFFINGLDLGYYLDVITDLGFRIEDVDVDCGRNMDKFTSSLSRLIGFDIFRFVGESCDCCFERRLEDFNEVIKKLENEVIKKLESDMESNVCGDPRGPISTNASINPLNSLDAKELTKIISENLKRVDFRFTEGRR